MESKEINKSKSTLTQGTMSRTVFPSFRIFLLSFSFPRDLLHEVFRCTFCAYLFFVFLVWISLLSNFFFVGVFWFLPYAYQFLLLEIHIPACWTGQKKKTENPFAEITAKKIVWTSIIYFWNLYMCWKNMLFKRSWLILISEKILSWSSIIFLRCPFSVKEWLRRSLDLNKGQS